MNFLRIPGWLHLPDSWLRGAFAPHEAAAAEPAKQDPPGFEPPRAHEPEDEFEGEGWSFWPR